MILAIWAVLTAFWCFVGWIALQYYTAYEESALVAAVLLLIGAGEGLAFLALIDSRRTRKDEDEEVKRIRAARARADLG